MVFKVYLFRHGQTTFNRDEKFTGQSNVYLTKLGISQAESVAQKLKGKDIRVAIHTSLTRSKQTLRIVLKYHPECRVILQDDRMIERSYGIYEGKTHKWFIETAGRQEVEFMRKAGLFDGFSKDALRRVELKLGKEEYDAVHRGWDVRAPGGESFADVEKRVWSFFKDLKKFVKRNKVNVAVSAHGNSIRLFRKIVEGASKEEAIRWFIPFDKFFEYTIR
ncbi:histidine phosphatase family protein [Candidatus Pacearchaeota archaeon]|nr:MAG: histidine phosphatase family protein [Candidatus Pacearchaeota archaeon]